MTGSLRILHTSDWHIGVSLFGRKRYEESDAFLNWLLKTIEEENIHVLLVSGDIFDTTTPSNRAQELYYRFLCRAARTSCRHIVITSGNHDSPSFLNAPRELLYALNIHVFGSVPENPEEEVLVLRDSHNEPELVVAAVPYLRDADVREARIAESAQDREERLSQAIADHFRKIGQAAEQRRQDLGKDIPLLCMAHLFTQGGLKGEGERDLYVGNLASIGPDIFSPYFDYVALGHLHVPQRVHGHEKIRYSGSPIPMGFGEAGQEKSVVVLEAEGRSLGLRTIPVPLFQRLEQIRGRREEITQRIEALLREKASVWLEIIHDGGRLETSLPQDLEELVRDSPLEILKITDLRTYEACLAQSRADETLNDLNPTEVFLRLLDSRNIAEEDREELLETYQEALRDFSERDANAE